MALQPEGCMMAEMREERRRREGEEREEGGASDRVRRGRGWQGHVGVFLLSVSLMLEFSAALSSPFEGEFLRFSLTIVLWNTFCASV